MGNANDSFLGVIRYEDWRCQLEKRILGPTDLCQESLGPPWGYLYLKLITSLRLTVRLQWLMHILQKEIRINLVVIDGGHTDNLLVSPWALFFRFLLCHHIVPFALSEKCFWYLDFFSVSWSVWWYDDHEICWCSQIQAGQVEKNSFKERNLVFDFISTHGSWEFHPYTLL